MNRKGWGAAIALASFAGCALRGGGLERPDVALTGVRPAAFGAEGGTLELRLTVTNPNGFAIAGERLDVNLEVEGEALGRLSVQAPFRLPAGGDTTLTAPFTFRWAGLGEAARAALRSGEVEYRMRGGVYLATPYDAGPVPFERRGTVSLRPADEAPAPRPAEERKTEGPRFEA
jgi:LEA14-like dessication related protein